MENQKWAYLKENASKSRFKKIHKDYPDESESCFANLSKIISALNSGIKLGVIKIGFFRSEGKGLYRVGQTGVESAKELRLYVYFNELERECHILSIGTKETQQKDIISAQKQISKMKK